MEENTERHREHISDDYKPISTDKTRSSSDNRLTVIECTGHEYLGYCISE